MVKILSLSFALAAFGMAVMAQEESSVSSSVAPASSSSASEPVSTSSAPASSSASSSSAASSQPTSSSSSGGNDSQVCSILVGKPGVHAHDCTYSSTYTPPYDQSSIINYLLGSYSPGVEATPVDVVATQLAGDVLKYYPTLIVSKADLAGDFKDAISASIDAARQSGKSPYEDSAITNKALSYGAAFSALVLGAIFVL